MSTPAPPRQAKAGVPPGLAARVPRRMSSHSPQTRNRGKSGLALRLHAARQVASRGIVTCSWYPLHIPPSPFPSLPLSLLLRQLVGTRQRTGRVTGKRRGMAGKGKRWAAVGSGSLAGVAENWWKTGRNIARTFGPRRTARAPGARHTHTELPRSRKDDTRQTHTPADLQAQPHSQKSAQMR